MILGEILQNPQVVNLLGLPESLMFGAKLLYVAPKRLSTLKGNERKTGGSID